MREGINVAQCSQYGLQGPRKVTLRQSALSQGRTETSKKTSDSLGNLRVDETNMDGAPEETLEQISCIQKSMPYTLLLLRNWASESGQSRKIP